MEHKYGYISSFPHKKNYYRGTVTEYSTDGSSTKVYVFKRNNLTTRNWRPELYSFVQFDVVTDPVASKQHATNICSIQTNRLGYIYHVEFNQEENSFFGFMHDCSPLDESAISSQNHHLLDGIKWEYNNGLYFNNYTFLQDQIPAEDSFVVFDIGYNPHTGLPVAMCKEIVDIKRLGYIKYYSANGGLIVDCESGEQYPYHAATFYVQNSGKALPSHMAYVLFGIARNPLNRPYAIIRSINYEVDESKLSFKLSTAVEESRKQKEKKQSERQEPQSESTAHSGIVVSMNGEVGIVSEGQKQYTFFKKDNPLFDTVSENDTVSFYLKKSMTKKGRSFFDAIIKSKEVSSLVSVDSPIDKEITEKVETLTEIKKSLYKRTSQSWKVEAIRETEDLFYVIDEYEDIAEGHFPFVIGRKGTGKSAICTYLKRQIDADSTKFRTEIKIEDVYRNHYFYNKVREEKGVGIKDVDYKLIWMFILYERFLQLFAEDESVDRETRDTIQSVLPSGHSHNQGTFSLAKLRVTVLKSIESEWERKDVTPVTLSSHEEVSLLERCLKQLCSVSANRYYILLDELQKAQSEVDVESGILITKTLLMAIEYIHQEFSDYSGRLIPIAFIRDDTYRLINYDDKDKWTDLTVCMSWNKTKIRKMLAHRIWKTLDNNEPKPTFEEAWKLYFPSTFTKVGNKPLFDNIYEFSFGRPRDFVHFLIESCKRAVLNDTTDLEQQWDVQITRFAKYCAESAENEVSNLIRDYHRIIEAFKVINRTSFTFEEFLKVYAPIPNAGIEMLKKEFNTLYTFMIIGMVSDSGWLFADSDVDFNISRQLVLHKSFWDYLQISVTGTSAK